MKLVIADDGFHAICVEGREKGKVFVKQVVGKGWMEERAASEEEMEKALGAYRKNRRTSISLRSLFPSLRSQAKDEHKSDGCSEELHSRISIQPVPNLTIMGDPLPDTLSRNEGLNGPGGGDFGGASGEF